MRPNRTFMAICIAIATPAYWVSTASAQTRADPADPGARVPAATYRSPFADYRALGDESVGNWRAANDEVGRIGGWREYARDAQAPGAAGTASGEAPAPPVRQPNPPGAHGGHTMPGGKQ